MKGAKSITTSFVREKGGRVGEWTNEWPSPIILTHQLHIRRGSQIFLWLYFTNKVCDSRWDTNGWLRWGLVNCSSFPSFLPFANILLFSARGAIFVIFNISYFVVETNPTLLSLCPIQFQVPCFDLSLSLSLVFWFPFSFTSIG